MKLTFPSVNFLTSFYCDHEDICRRQLLLEALLIIARDLLSTVDATEYGLYQ